MSVRWGCKEYKCDSPDPYHKVPPVDDPEASNGFPDCPVKEAFGDKGNDVEGAMVGVKPRSDRMEVDQTEGQKASQAVLGQKDKRGGGSFKGTRRNRY